MLVKLCSLTGLIMLAVLIARIAAAQDTAPTPRPPSPEPQAPVVLLRDYTDLLRTQAERSEKAAQATASALQGYFEILKSHAERSEQVTKHEQDTIERTMASFIQFIYICGGLLLVGATAFGWILAYLGKANKAEIEAEVRRQTRGEIAEAMNRARLTVSEETEVFQRHLRRMRENLTILQDNMNRMEQQREPIVSFQKSEALTPELQEDLEQTLDAYGRYLSDIGYKSSERLAKFRVDRTVKSGARYNPEANEIVVAKDLAVDPDVALREYTHHVLRDVKKGEIPLWTSIQSGLADYFPCSFKNSPHFAEKAAPILRKMFPGIVVPQDFVRNMDNQRKFSEIEPIASSKQDAGEVWSGALWEIRKLVGREQVDRVFLEAWTTSDVKDDSMASYVNFLDSIFKVAVRHGLAVSALRAIFEKRGLSVPIEMPMPVG
jgi:hypothetical protein